jgi:hypothetical protein
MIRFNRVAVTAAVVGALLGGFVAAPAQAGAAPSVNCRVVVTKSGGANVLTILDHKMSGHLKATFKGKANTLFGGLKPFTRTNVNIPHKSTVKGSVWYAEATLYGVKCKPWSNYGV